MSTPTFMFLYLTTALALLLGIVALFLSKIKIIKLNSPWETLLWTLRTSLFKHPLPKTTDEWHMPLQGDFDADVQAFRRILDTWAFLAPFFAAHGYTLYHEQKSKRTDAIYPPSSPPPAEPALEVYPYARRVARERPPEVCPGSTFVWAARDNLGREVMIKVVSEVPTPSAELQVLRRLNEEPLRSDPRNHSIYVLDYLRFDKFIFAVMPRWDPAWRAGFSNVLEMMEYTKTLLEGLVFLHQHRIAHQDILDQNIGMNIFGDWDAIYNQNGLRTPGEVRYAFYDFGHSLLFPEDTDIDTVQVTRYQRYLHGKGPIGAFKPFKVDVAMLGYTLQHRVRYAEPVVPELGRFLDWMQDEDEDRRPNARRVLDEFVRLYDGLTTEQLQTEITADTTIPWKAGRGPKPL